MKKYVNASLNFSDIADFRENGLESNDHSLIMFTNRYVRDDLDDIQQAIQNGNTDDLQEAYELFFEDTDEAIELIKEMVDVVNDDVKASGLMKPYQHFEA